MWTAVSQLLYMTLWRGSTHREINVSDFKPHLWPYIRSLPAGESLRSFLSVLFVYIAVAFLKLSLSSASMILTPPLCRRWLRELKILAIYAKIRMISDFLKKFVWQCCCSSKNRANFIHIANLPRYNHRMLESYRNTSNPGPILSHSCTKMLRFRELFWLYSHVQQNF